MSARRPIYRDVHGAPFRIGDRVSVIGSEDETFDPRYRGRTGAIRYLEYQCGCGQSYPGDPMIGVEFRGGKVEEFWREELKRISLTDETKSKRTDCEQTGRVSLR